MLASEDSTIPEAVTMETDDDSLNNSDVNDNQNHDDVADEMSDQNNDQENSVDENDSEKLNSSQQEMSEKERNAYYAQRRIEAREKNKSVMDELRNRVVEKINENYSNVSYGDIPEEAAEQLRQNAIQNERMRAEIELERVSLQRETIANSFERAEESIQVFNQSSSSFNSELHDLAMQSYADAYLETVQNSEGEQVIIGLREGSPNPYDYMKRIADVYYNSSKQVAQKAQEAAQRNLSRSEHRGNYISQSGSYEDLSPKEMRKSLESKGLL